jgi:hypothetical protein
MNEPQRVKEHFPMSNVMLVRLKTTLIAALLSTASLLLPCAHAQPDDANRRTLAQLRAAAQKDDAQSQFELGVAFSLGKFGVAQDYVEAVKWFRRAAEQNLAAAQSNLGICYERGDGVAKYELEALKWYLLAAAQGETKAKRNATLLELLLSPEEIAEGKRRAQAWLEQQKTTTLSPPMIESLKDSVSRIGPSPNNSNEYTNPHFHDHQFLYEQTTLPTPCATDLCSSFPAGIPGRRRTGAPTQPGG